MRIPTPGSYLFVAVFAVALAGCTDDGDKASETTNGADTAAGTDATANGDGAAASDVGDNAADAGGAVADTTGATDAAQATTDAGTAAQDTGGSATDAAAGAADAGSAVQPDAGPVVHPAGSLGKGGAIAFGSSKLDMAFDIAADSKGDVVLVGAYHADVQIGGATLKVRGGKGSDMFIAKLDASGGVVWVRDFGSDEKNVEMATSVAIDANDNIYVAGNFYGTAAFGSISKTSKFKAAECYVAKLSPAGKWLWVAVGANGGYGSQCGDPTTYSALTVATDDAGNAVLSGGFVKTVQFGATKLTALKGFVAADAFVAKVDASGKWLWAKRAGSSSPNDSGRGVAVGKAGKKITAVGTFRDGGKTADFGATKLKAKKTDAYVARLDGAGKWLWTKAISGGGNDTPQAVVMDDKGAAYVTGVFSTDIDLGGTKLAVKQGNSFVAKIGDDGKWLWAKNAKLPVHDGPWDIARDHNGDLLITGPYAGEPKLGTLMLPKAPTSKQNAFVARLAASDGKWLWAKSGGGDSLKDAPRGVTSDSKGQVWAAGVIGQLDTKSGQKVTYDGVTLTHKGWGDILVWKVSP